MEYIVGALLIFIGIQEYFNRQERQKLVDRIIAKSVDDLVKLAPPGKMRVVPEQTDLIPLENVSDDEFDKAIKQSLGRGQGVLEKLKSRVRGK